MNALLAVLDFLAAHGPTVALGVTVVLLAGQVAARCCRQPAERRRLGLLTALAAGGYLAFALLPLPRWTIAESATHPASRAPSALPRAVPITTDPAARAAALLAALDRLEALPAPTLAVPAAHVSPASSASPLPPTSSPSLAAGAAGGLAPAVSSARELPWGRIAAAVWLATASSMLVWSLVGLLRLRALVRRCRPGPAQLARAAGLPAGTRFLVAPCAVRPFCAFGWRTVVVVPETLLAPERRGQALAVLRHEAAHVRARDPLAQLLLTALAVPLGLHPLFWWLARDVRFHAELLADDAAAAATGSTSYARELLDLAERAEPVLAAAGAVSVFHRPSDFFRRIQMLLQREGRLVPSPSRWRRAVQSCAAFALVASTAAVLGVPAAAQGQGTRELRNQNAALRTELDALRAELDSLRELLQRQHPGAPRTELAPITYGELMPDGRVEPRTPPPGWPFAGSAGAQDPALTPQPTPGTAPAPSAPPATGVPILSEIPVVGDLFRRTPDPTAPAPGAPPTDVLAPASPEGTPPAYPGHDPLLAPGAGTRMGASRGVEFTEVPVRPYAVRKGDSLDRIAVRELHSAERIPEIMALNPGLDPTVLRVGQTIRLPALTLAEVLAPGQPSTPSQPAVPGATDPFAGAPGVGADPTAAWPAPATAPPAPQQERGAVATTEAIAELVTRCLDLQAELELAEHEAAELKTMSEQGLSPKHEARRAVVKLGSLKKKHAVVRELVEGEIAATESELTWLARERDDASPSDRLRLDMQLHRARTRLAALQAAK